jgi:IS6 family transposase
VTALRHGAFFTRALGRGLAPVEATTDRAPVYPRLIADLVPAARHVLQQYSGNAVEADHGRLKVRLRPMRGPKTIRSLRTVAAGHAFVQVPARRALGVRRGRAVHERVWVAFVELALCL